MLSLQKKSKIYAVFWCRGNSCVQPMENSLTTMGNTVGEVGSGSLGFSSPQNVYRYAREFSTGSNSGQVKNNPYIQAKESYPTINSTNKS